MEEFQKGGGSWLEGISISTTNHKDYKLYHGRKNEESLKPSVILSQGSVCIHLRLSEKKT